MTFDLKSFIEAVGYFGVALIVFAESGLLIGFFLPGDSLLFTAGLLAADGYFKVSLLALVSFLAAVFGDSLGYSFGFKIGPKLFNREDSLLFHKDHLRRANEFYRHHGGKTIVLARFLPFIRTFAPIVAGIGRMNYTSFLIFNLLGGFGWTFGLSYAGYFLGRAVPDIDRFLIPIIILIVVLSVFPTLVHFWKDNRRLIIEWLGKRSK